MNQLEIKDGPTNKLKPYEVLRELPIYAINDDEFTFILHYILELKPAKRQGMRDPALRSSSKRESLQGASNWLPRLPPRRRVNRTPGLPGHSASTAPSSGDATPRGGSREYGYT